MTRPRNYKDVHVRNTLEFKAYWKYASLCECGVPAEGCDSCGPLAMRGNRDKALFDNKKFEVESLLDSEECEDCLDVSEGLAKS